MHGDQLAITLNANAHNDGGRLCYREDVLQKTASITHQHGNNVVYVIIHKSYVLLCLILQGIHGM